MGKDYMKILSLSLSLSNMNNKKCAHAVSVKQVLKNDCSLTCIAGFCLEDRGYENSVFWLHGMLMTYSTCDLVV